MAKNNAGCSAIITVGAAMFFLGLLTRGCSGDSHRSTALSDYSQSGPANAPLPAKLPLARDGTAIAAPESYVPKTLIIQQPARVATWDGQKMTGSRMLPVGTEVKVKAVDGYDVYIEVDGHGDVIKASATDLLEQMTQAAGGVE